MSKCFLFFAFHFFLRNVVICRLRLGASSSLIYREKIFPLKKFHRIFEEISSKLDILVQDSNF